MLFIIHSKFELMLSNSICKIGKHIPLRNMIVGKKTLRKTCHIVTKKHRLAIGNCEWRRKQRPDVRQRRRAAEGIEPILCAFPLTRVVKTKRSYDIIRPLTVAANRDCGCIYFIRLDSRKSAGPAYDSRRRPVVTSENR